MTRSYSVASIALLCAASLGCPSRQVAKIDPAQQGAEVKDIPIVINRDIDILFVIDNSGSMAEEQVSLAANFPQFISVLENIEGGLPNVHIGVVSSDVGALGQNVQGCMGAGDNGLLQNMPRITGCMGPTGRFIKDLALGTGDRDRNFAGTLAETFTCIASLGDDGCGFEQHLEAMHRALRTDLNVENAGFLRPNAYLAVIFLADEDDCSAADAKIFDPSQDSNTAELGYLTSFRCAEFGVTCDEGNISRTPGSYTNCKPRLDSYLQDPKFYADFLKGLKPDKPRNVIVAGIIGNPMPFNTDLDVDMRRCGDSTTKCVPSLAPSCNSANGSADAGVRLASFMAEFPDRNTFTSICNQDLSDALVQIADLLARVIGTPCFESPVDTTDLDPANPGLQIDCQVSDVENPDTNDEVQRPLPRCQMQDATTPVPNQDKPCWYVFDNPDQCSDQPTGLALGTLRDDTTATDLNVRAQCKTR